MQNLEAQIEAILLFKNEPISEMDLCRWLKKSPEEIKATLESLQAFYKQRGIVLVTDGEYYNFGTHAELSDLISTLQKEEFSRELGRAGLETLAVILYRGPISRREIDQIRGVNSGFILRSLLIRGLIERSESTSGERSYSYKPTLKLLEHLGVTKIEDLPEYETAFKKMTEFINTEASTTDAQ